MIRKILDSKIVRIISTVIEWVIGITLVILVCLTLFQSISKQGDFFGYRVYIVGSESMVPMYYVGDTLLVKETPIENIDIGDTVTYVGEYEGIEGLIITHQLKKKELDRNGEFLLHVKGIANDVEDPVVHESQLLGKVVYKFVILSFLGKIITNTYLTILCITVPIVLLILIEIIKLIFKKDMNVFEKTKKDDVIPFSNHKEDDLMVEENKEIKSDTESLKMNVIKVGNEILELPKKKDDISSKNKRKDEDSTAVKIKNIDDILDNVDKDSK